MDTPEIFRCHCSEQFDGLAAVVVGDFPILGGTEEEHDKKLTAVLEKARLMDLRLNSEKAQLKQTLVKFLGHTIQEMA